MSAKDGGAAFPVTTDRRDMAGMTLRDYFAAKAMQGDMASGDVSSNNFGFIAQRAYQMADAMLAERGRE